MEAEDGPAHPPEHAQQEFKYGTGPILPQIFTLLVGLFTLLRSLSPSVLYPRPSLADLQRVKSQARPPSGHFAWGLPAPADG